MTISSDDLVRRNAAFAAMGAFAGLLVSGLVYDVTTGLIEIADPATQE